jgi:hypothetical protein
MKKKLKRIRLFLSQRGITIIENHYNKCKFCRVYLGFWEVCCEILKISVKMISNFDKWNFCVGDYLFVSGSILRVLKI